MSKLTNGFGLRALTIALLVAFAPQTQLTAQTPPRVLTQTEFGWQIGKDGALECIVQLSPTVVQRMQMDNKEKECDMPTELVGRASRIVVRFGTGPLPREPSLQEIKQRFPLYSNANDALSATLGAGRMSDVEPSSVVNVQQDPGLPSLPTFGRPGASGNLADQAAAVGGSLIERGGEIAREAANNASESFLSGAGGRTTPPDFPTTTRPNPNQPAVQLPGTSKFSDTAGDPGNALARQRQGTEQQPQVPPYGAPRGNGADRRDDLWTGSPRPGSNATPDDTSRLADTRNPNYGGGVPGTNRPRDTYDSRVPPALSGDTGYTGIPRRGDEPLGFGGGNRSDRQPTNYDRRGVAGDYGYGNEGGTQRGYADEIYTGRGYGDERVGGQRGYGGGQSGNGYIGQGNRRPNPGNLGQGPGFAMPPTQPTTQVASLPGTTPPTQPTTTPASASDKVTPTTPPAQNLTEAGSSTVKKTSDVLMQMFFLVSLVANVYLVFLIRKLLTRYRSLLTTVRGQTA